RTPVMKRMFVEDILDSLKDYVKANYGKEDINALDGYIEKHEGCNAWDEETWSLCTIEGFVHLLKNIYAVIKQRPEDKRAKVCETLKIERSDESKPSESEILDIVQDWKLFDDLQANTKVEFKRSVFAHVRRNEIFVCDWYIKLLLKIMENKNELRCPVELERRWNGNTMNDVLLDGHAPEKYIQKGQRTVVDASASKGNYWRCLLRRLTVNGTELFVQVMNLKYCGFSEAIILDEDYLQNYDIAFASSFATVTALTQLIKRRQLNAIRLYNFITNASVGASFRGQLFEALCHVTLPLKAEYNIRRLYHNDQNQNHRQQNLPNIDSETRTSQNIEGKSDNVNVVRIEGDKFIVSKNLKSVYFATVDDENHSI
ncbi:hypothetical protein ROZALSC1DRAFT_24045, partial [Rozella allomycis CSF55]